MKIIGFIFLWLVAIIVFSVILCYLSEFLENRRIHRKFIFFGNEDEPTKFFFNEEPVTIYVKRSRLKDEVNEYSSNLFYETLYINNIPAIGVECFERLFHTHRDVHYNSKYKAKEIDLIIKQGIKEWHKQIDEKFSKTKSIFDKENKNEES